MQRIKGSFSRPKGFLVGSAAAGIKTDKTAHDVAVFASEVEAAAAAVFTTNPICGAPVMIGRERIKARRARAIVVNAGCANVCTGKRGMRDGERMAAIVAKHLNADPQRVLVASTGIIGEHLPMEKIVPGVNAACNAMGRSLRCDAAAARAIMTTDTRPKESAVCETIGGVAVTMGGTAKGSGMIAPNMATMLCFLSTDCRIDARLLDAVLRRVNNDTFNCVTVDGDRSTSDSVFLLANGCADNRRISRSGRDLDAFETALSLLRETLAKAVAADGEGATKFVEIVVRGGRNARDAHVAAMAIADSPLVKTALYGEDPNWGRIITAAGYSGAALAPEKIRLSLNGKCVYRQGRPVAGKKGLAARMRKREIRIEIDLGAGNATRTVWTCDLSHKYVDINAHYHT